MEPYLTIDEASELTKFAVATLRKYVLQREVPFHKVRGAIRFRASELEPWMASGGSMLKTDSEGEGKGVIKHDGN
jgi:excisionase family DNA binding protein